MEKHGIRQGQLYRGQRLSKGCPVKDQFRTSSWNNMSIILMDSYVFRKVKDRRGKIAPVLGQYHAFKIYFHTTHRAGYSTKINTSAGYVKILGVAIRIVGTAGTEACGT